MIYYKDAARAAAMVLQAPAGNIQMINYNVGGIRRVTPREMESALRMHLPAVAVSYVSRPGPPLPQREIAWDDSHARSEWGWAPEYADIERVVSDCTGGEAKPGGTGWHRETGAGVLISNVHGNPFPP
jgi:nucleoside-diphosphate-sugar epimerase